MFESLETRRMFAVGFAGGTITVTELAGNDTIQFNLSPAGNLLVHDNGVVTPFALGAVTSIVVNSGAGNDLVDAYPGLGIPLQVFAGAGNDSVGGGEAGDLLVGGDGNDVIYGRYGNDSVDGSAGADSLYGGYGDDTLRGGLGADFIYGNDGDDNLFAGEGAGDVDGAVDGGPGADILGSADPGDPLAGFP